MFGFIIFIIVLTSVIRLFSRPFTGYYRPRIFPFGGFGGFGGWGMGYHPPMHHMHQMHHHGPHHHMGHGRRW